MKVTEHIKNAKGKTLFSFELIPPQKGRSIDELYNNIDPLMEFNPPFIDVTTSREEFIYIDRDGLLDKKLTRMRPGTVGICASIKHKYDVDTIPHVLCGGFTKEETEYLLVDCHYLGIDNVMALRGDAMKEEKYFTPRKGGHGYANELVTQIANMNNGQFLHEVIESDNKSDFCIGVAGYPEKHMEAPSIDSDLRWLKKKVDAGADYIVTQMFFDNKSYFSYVDACRAAGIDVPIVPGLKPITKKYQLNSIPRKFFVNMPEEFVKAMMKAKGSEQIKQTGIEWCIHQSQELKKAGVPCMHYYTMGDSDTTKKIIDAL